MCDFTHRLAVPPSCEQGIHSITSGKAIGHIHERTNTHSRTHVHHGGYHVCLSPPLWPKRAAQAEFARPNPSLVRTPRTAGRMCAPECRGIRLTPSSPYRRRCSAGRQSAGYIPEQVCAPDKHTGNRPPCGSIPGSSYQLLSRLPLTRISARWPTSSDFLG